MTMGPFTISFLSFLLAVAAQSTTTNSLIPANVSPGCQTSLSNLNTDSNLKGCISSIVSATSAVTNQASSSLSSSTVTNALDSLCSAQASCSTTGLRQLLTDVGVQCASDFDNSNVVSGTYDILYTLLPLWDAMCTKDTSSGSYCAAQASSTGNQTLDLSGYNPELLFGSPIGDFGADSLPFFFVPSDAPSSLLCSQCFTGVMQSYISFEAILQYEMGVNQSPLLQNQGQLWKAFHSQCGTSAAGTIAINAGAAPKEGAAPARPAAHAGALVGLALFVGALVLF